MEIEALPYFTLVSIASAVALFALIVMFYLAVKIEEARDAIYESDRINNEPPFYPGDSDEDVYIDEARDALTGLIATCERFESQDRPRRLPVARADRAGRRKRAARDRQGPRQSHRRLSRRNHRPDGGTL
jgi:hypothetical protein